MAVPNDLSPDVWIVVDSVLAGVTAFGGLACLFIWRYDRSLRAFLWAGLMALTMTLTLLCGAVIFARPGRDLTTAAVFLRCTLYGTAALFGILTARHLVPGLSVRWALRAVAAVLVLRTALWWPTELLAHRRADADGWPSYGDLFWTSGLYNVVIVAVGALAFRRTAGSVRAVIVLCGAALGFLTVIPHVVDGPGIREESLTLNAVPGGIAVLFLVARVLLRNARGHDTLTRRQAVLLRLSQAAVTEPVDTLRRRVERELRTELHKDVVVAVSGLDRFPQPGSSDGAGGVTHTIRVSGRRQRAVVRGLGAVPEPTRQFVESVLRVLVAAVDRALGDADFAHATGHDGKTGLPNLTAFTARLADRLEEGRVGGSRVLLLLCRVEGLGQLAAVDGSDSVETLMSRVADVLSRTRRSRTALARIGTEAFAVADPMPASEVEGFLAARLCELRTAVAAAEPSVQLSIGAAEAGAGATAATLFSDAAAALDRAPAGGNAVFDDEIGAELRARAALDRDLASALANDEIEVHYQPVVLPSSRAVVAVEALARWRRHGEMTAPDVWIPAAERLGLIHDVGRRVLAVAARDQARLGVPVAVNVSPLQLAEPSFVDDVLAAIGDCPPRRVVLEMTESAVMADLKRSIGQLLELRGHGIRIALDDFGSSYSSLSALADLPVDILKLDSSFVARLDQPNGVAVVQAVVALGRSLGKPIVAEGVETEAQLDLLTALSVDRVQGYLLGRPTTVGELAGSLPSHPSAPFTEQPDDEPDPEPPRLFVVGPVAKVR